MSETELPELKMTRNPLRLKKDILFKDLLEEFLEMKYNLT